MSEIRASRYLLLVATAGFSVSACAPSHSDVPEFETQVVQALAAHVSQMNRQRAYHAATELSDGRVLVCGGTNDFEGGQLDSCEVYDPTSATWSLNAWPKLPAPSEQLNLVLMLDGRVLALGGMGSDTLTIAEARAGTSQGWSEAEPIASRAQATATRFYDGSILVVGGTLRGPSSGIQAETELRVADDTAVEPDRRWQMVGSLSRFNHAATLLASGREVLVSGGQPQPLATKPTSAVERYNIDNGRWQSASPMHYARSEHTATLLEDGRVLVVGGEAASGTSLSLSQCEIYDPTTDSWSFAAESHARAGHVAGRLGPYVIVAGGAADNLQGGLDSVELYDPASDAWHDLPSLSAARQATQLTPTLTPEGDPALLVSGGSNGTVWFDTAELIAPSLMGHSCREDADCALGVCADGVCCERACAGVCQACNAQGQCRDVHGEPRVGHGACVGGFVCGDAGACRSECASDSDCARGYYCDDGRCVTQLPPGHQCDKDQQCMSGLFCVDGVCCSSRCDGPCQSCDGSGDA